MALPSSGRAIGGNRFEGSDYSLRLPNGSLISLYNSDCVTGLDAIADGSIDVIVTSPPYNLGIGYGTYDDSIPRGQYLDWLTAVSQKLKTKLAIDGSIFLNVGSAPSSPWGPFETIMSLRSVFHLQNVIHWVKSIYVENESYGTKQTLNVGHYKPINSHRFLNDTHEFIFHLTRSGQVQIDRLSIGVPYKDEGNVSRWKDGATGVRCRGNCWYVPYRTIQSRQGERPHPATFPPELAEMCIRLHGLVKGRLLVVDPFMGIGSTAIASARLGVDCVGFELDREYFTTSVRQLEQLESPKPAALSRKQTTLPSG